MTASRVRQLSVGLVVLAVAMTAGATVISVIDGNRADPRNAFQWTIMLVFATAGYLIARNQPGNAIGWVFLGVGVSAGLSRLTSSYGDYWTATGHGSRYLAEVALAYGNVAWIPFILVPATFVLLLFPDGHLLSSRWRPVGWCAVAGISLGWVAQLVTPGPLESHPGVDNPLGINSPIVDPAQGLTLLIAFVGVMGSAASLVVRFRRAQGEQRQQMKWIALAGTVAGVTIPVLFVVYDVIGKAAADSAIEITVLGLPVATAVAIIRYRLYDIDVVINRALVYGSLTATLAAVYVGTVLALQLLLRGLTQGSGLAVAGSTLAAAAVVRPGRARIQAIVDRRFFRRRYDAKLVVQTFGTKLRDDIDLTRLHSDLLQAVHTTVQPEHVSLWLRSGKSPREDREP